MLLNERVKILSGQAQAERKYAQFASPNWGTWGKERYTWRDPQLAEKHTREKKKLRELLADSTPRIAEGLNFSYGICDLSGYSSPITPAEHRHLSSVYQNAVQHASSLADPGLRFLTEELYCIRTAAGAIEGFTKGNFVNDTADESIWRKYVHLDFFKFSRINLLMRVSLEEMNSCEPSAFAANLALAFFLGSGSFVEKASLFFDEETFVELKRLSSLLTEKIEEYPEYPVCRPESFRKEFEDLAAFIRRNKKLLIPEQLFKGMEEQRLTVFREGNRYYEAYTRMAVRQTDETGDPVKRLGLLWKEALQRPDHPLEIKNKLRQLRFSLDKRYALNVNDFIPVNDFYRITSHPYFIGLRYEGEILGKLYGLEHPESKHASALATILKELLPYHTCRKDKKDRPFEDRPHAWKGEMPLLALAHHVHNANCDTLKQMMQINRQLQWPMDKQVLNISSSSSREEVILQERKACLETGFNHYRIHARQHMKAGNQNRAVWNAIDCRNKEYYLTLDDDYFIFPEYPKVAHEEIVQKNLEYYQSPLAFKGIYRPGASNGERADAEMMHYFEGTLGNIRANTYSFPRGTGTMFAFTDGISTLSDTGGFLIDHLSEDFGQGYLSMLQHANLCTAKRLSTANPGTVGEKILCIGEGVDLSGKIMQMIRWSHGAKIYFYILLPTVLKNLIRGRTRLLSNKHLLHVFLFTPVHIASKFLGMGIYLLPFLLYLSALGNGKGFSFPGNNSQLLSIGLLSIAWGVAHYQVILKRYSWAPARIMLMDYLATFYCVQGYIKGIFGMTPKWTANKTKKIKWKQYYGIAIPLVINGITASLAIRSGQNIIAGWSAFNTGMYLLGFLYLTSPGKLSAGPIRFPRKLMVVLFQCLSILVASLCALYLKEMIEIAPKIKGIAQAGYFTFLVIFIFNFFANVAIASYSVRINRQGPSVN